MQAAAAHLGVILVCLRECPVACNADMLASLEAHLSAARCLVKLLAHIACARAVLPPSTRPAEAFGLSQRGSWRLLTSLPDMIPRSGMLQVLPEGEYKPPPPSNAKASYATMVYVRATIVEGAGWALARSVTIAVSGLALHTKTCGLLQLAGETPHPELVVSREWRSTKVTSWHSLSPRHACCCISRQLCRPHLSAEQ